MSNFICKTCGKEKDTYPRSIDKEGKMTCWECETLEKFNYYEKIYFDELKEEIKKYMLESFNDPANNSIHIVSDLLNFIKNRNEIYDFNGKFEHLRKELELLSRRYYDE